MQFSMGKSSEAESSDNDLSTITGEGPNLYLAVKQARSALGKEIFFTHNQVLLLGEEVIKTNPIATIEEYINYCDYHSTAFISGVHGKAEDIISLTYKDEYSDKNKVMIVLENSKQKGFHPVYRLYETLMNAYNLRGSCFIPMLRVVNDKTASDDSKSRFDSGEPHDNDSQRSKSNEKSEEEENSSEDSGDSGDSPGSGGQSSGQPNVVPDGGVIIIDGKFAAFMNEEQSQGLSFLVNTSNTSNVVFEHDETVFTLELFKKKTKIFPEFDGERLTFTVKFSTVADSVYNHILDSYDNELFKELAEESVKAKLHEAVVASVGIGGDLINLEDSVKFYDYKSWLKIEDNWNEMLKNAKFVYHAQIEIK